ncbi:hypothetical protein ACH4E7_33820 [Kitasatospora sp. NPDC018058]|uniref:hypothetical protein n=1 Tax=Kitasatospora sp. NPDC018058 TaxID=3364025 RepID=UPI0037BE5575
MPASCVVGEVDEGGDVDRAGAAGGDLLQLVRLDDHVLALGGLASDGHALNRQARPRPDRSTRGKAMTGKTDLRPDHSTAGR